MEITTINDRISNCIQDMKETKNTRKKLHTTLTQAQESGDSERIIELQQQLLDLYVNKIESLWNSLDYLKEKKINNLHAMCRHLVEELKARTAINNRLQRLQKS